MKDQYSRRDFIKGVSLLSLGAATGGMENLQAFAEEVTKETDGPVLKTSLNAYSFNNMLNDHLQHRGPGVTLPQVLEFAAQCKFQGFDATGYYFPGYPEKARDSYVDELRRRAADLGIGISGTGVRDNLTTSDKVVRAASVQHIKEWVEVAARLGAPVIRVFADTQMRAMTWQETAKGYTREQVQEWIAAGLKECADHGRQYGVCIGVQNHGDFLQTGEQLMALIGAVNSDWCKPIVDTGHFKAKYPMRT